MSRLACISAAACLLFFSGIPFGTRRELALSESQQQVAAAAVPLPFVGCKSDGQSDMLDAPNKPTSEARLSPSVAARLALYQAEFGPAVIGPRGWSCFGKYGSSGASLYVTPAPLADDEWKGIAGAGIEASVSDGGTSGRFTVAEIAARMFPSQRAFVQKVLEENIVTGLKVPADPFPADHLTYINNLIVEYETPSRSTGLGTTRLLRSNVDSIRGVEIFDPTGEVSLWHLGLRLPKNMQELEPVVIKRFEETH